MLIKFANIAEIRINFLAIVQSHINTAVFWYQLDLLKYRNAVMLVAMAGDAGCHDMLMFNLDGARVASCK